MKEERIAAASDHLARLVGSRPLIGLAELVWNALDADADNVAIAVTTTPLRGVDKVTVTDDGTGFGASEVEGTFKSVGGSWKRYAHQRQTRTKRRQLHGEKGQGRWKLFSIGDNIRWESVMRDDSAGLLRTKIMMSSEHLDEFTWESELVQGAETGTTVTIHAGTREPNVLLDDSAPSDLAKTLALYLTQYPGIDVTYNGSSLDVLDHIDRRDELKVPLLNDPGKLTLVIIEWKFGVDRHSLFLCDEQGAALHEMSAGIRAPGFDFTAYALWQGFRTHESILPLADMDSVEGGSGP